MFEGITSFILSIIFLTLFYQEQLLKNYIHKNLNLIPFRFTFTLLSFYSFIFLLIIFNLKPIFKSLEIQNPCKFNSSFILPQPHFRIQLSLTQWKLWFWWKKLEFPLSDKITFAIWTFIIYIKVPNMAKRFVKVLAAGRDQKINPKDIGKVYRRKVRSLP